ncbi:3-oxoacyl-[acyl-carrier protein] reductase [Alkalibacter saccharofermentans DSM 14828]|uniref:3-oxoacyl-[acyl-carrier protein] reductase n=2 Tax=Alkalibacter TaxID=274470 RepID=A0A1M4T8H0_9FIRM|nr:3-oxoacyl-[acyl-carrier protein] reductase [Alkalibacter saccharofermentans DSM 14828]
MLKGKSAVVTGASKGIGKAIAIELAKNGADIVINYCSSEDAAKDLKKDIEALGSKAVLCCCDVSVPEEAKALVDLAVEKFGKIDILINNAGIGLAPPSALDITNEDFARVIDINLKGTFYCSMEAVREMMKRGSGKIIGISSSAVEQPRGGTAAYSASKSGVELLMNSLAQEFGPYGINVNIVAPGPTETEMLKDFFTPERKKEVESGIPLRRLAKPEDIAKAVLFLVSDMSGYITGQKILVDGGRTIR